MAVHLELEDLVHLHLDDGLAVDLPDRVYLGIESRLLRRSAARSKNLVLGPYRSSVEVDQSRKNVTGRG